MCDVIIQVPHCVCIHNNPPTESTAAITLTIKLVRVGEDDLADGEAALCHLLDDEGLAELIDHVTLPECAALSGMHQYLPGSKVTKVAITNVNIRMYVISNYYHVQF